MQRLSLGPTAPRSSRSLAARSDHEKGAPQVDRHIFANILAKLHNYMEVLVEDVQDQHYDQFNHRDDDFQEVLDPFTGSCTRFLSTTK